MEKRTVSLTQQQLDALKAHNSPYAEGAVPVTNKQGQIIRYDVMFPGSDAGVTEPLQKELKKIRN